MEKCFKSIVSNYSRILGKNLVGIYVHGSYAMNCFNENKSDLDFIVVTLRIPTQKQKEKMIQVLLKLQSKVTFKGFEMSVVLKRYCTNFTYPTPYELHFSPAYANYYKNDCEGMCLRMHGKDHDLAAHFMVINHRGICLTGEEISNVFKEVSRFDYLDSIQKDMENVEKMIQREPVYTILNCCRTYYYLKENIIASKLEGGLWALENTPKKLHKTILKAIESYTSINSCELTIKQQQQFLEFMRKEEVIHE